MPVRPSRPAVFLLATLLAWSGCGSSPPPRPPLRAEIRPRTEPATASSVARADLLARARERVNAQDFPGAIAALRSIAEEERAAVFRQLIEETAARDPRSATQMALALPRGNFQAETLSLTTRALLGREPDAAIAWALGVEDSSARIVVLDTLATEFATHDPRSALERLPALPEGPRRDELVRLTAARWARQDPDAALAWTAGLPEPERARVTTSIVFELAQTRPARAATLVASLPEGRERAFVYSSIAHTWVAVDPPAAEAWLRGLPAGAAKDAALAGMSAATGTLGARNSALPGINRRRNRPVALAGAPSANETVDAAALPPGPARDAALQREFESRLAASPTRAAAWVAQLSGADVSDEMLRRLARQWFREDPVSARTWFDQHVASPQRREQILFEAR